MRAKQQARPLQLHDTRWVDTDLLEKTQEAEGSGFRV